MRLSRVFRRKSSVPGSSDGRPETPEASRKVSNTSSSSQSRAASALEIRRENSDEFGSAAHSARQAARRTHGRNNSLMQFRLDSSERMLVLAEATKNQDDQKEAVRSLTGALTEPPRNESEVERAISLSERILRDPLPEEELRCILLHNLASLQYHKFSMTKDEEDLRNSVDGSRRAVELMPLTHRKWQSAVTALLEHVKEIADMTQSESDLDQALEDYKDVFYSVPDDHESLPIYLNAFGCLLIRRFVKLGQLEDVYQMATIAIALKKADIEEADAEVDQRKTNKSLDDIAAWASRLEPTVRSGLTPIEKLVVRQWCSKMKQEIMRNFADEDFLAAFEAFLDTRANLEIVIEVRNHDSAKILTEESYRMAFKLPGVTTVNHRLKMVDLKVAAAKPATPSRKASSVQEIREDVARVKEDYPKKTEYINRLVALSNEAMDFYAESNEREDFATAVEIAELAIARADTGQAGLGNAAQQVQKDDDRARAYGHMASILRSSYMKTKSLQEVNKACQYGAIAVAVSTKQTADLLFVYGLTLGAKYRLSGELASLEKGILALRDALGAAKPPAKAQILSELGLLYRHHFLKTGIDRSIDESIVSMQDALEELPSGSDMEITIHSNLGLAMWSRYEKSGEQSDIAEAIDNYTASLAKAPSNHPMTVPLKINLINAYASKLHKTSASPGASSSSDVLKAAALAAELERSLPHSDASYATIASDLCEFQLRKHGVTRDEADLDKAVTHAEAALALAPEGNPRRPAALQALAGALSRRCDVVSSSQQQQELRHRCIELLDEAMRSPAANAQTRAEIGLKLADMQTAAGMEEASWRTWEAVDAIRGASGWM